MYWGGGGGEQNGRKNLGRNERRGERKKVTGFGYGGRWLVCHKNVEKIQEGHRQRKKLSMNPQAVVLIKRDRRGADRRRFCWRGGSRRGQ